MTRQLPIVGYRNLLTEGTTEATTSNDKRSLAYNGLTYDAWPIEAGLQYLTVTFDSARACDYFAFSRHNLHTVAGRVRLEGWDGAAWIAVTDWILPDGKAQMVAFDTVTHEQYRVAVDLTLPCYIGVIYFGQRLTLIRGVGEGSIPSRQARNTEIIGVNSEGGQTLGRSLVRRAVRFPLLSRNYEPAWMRTEGQDFISHAERKGFFYAFDLGENPADVVFVEAVSIDQPDFVDAYRQNISMECGGPLDDGERVPEQVQGLTVTPDGDDLVLSWDAVTDADSYNVYRATDEVGPYTLIGSSLTAGFTDEDEELSGGEFYWYRVSAVDRVGEGPQSEQGSGLVSFLARASASTVTLGVGSEDTAPVDVVFSVDGSRLYVCGISDLKIYQYSMTEPFDIGTATYDTVSLDISSQTTSPRGVKISPDGSRIFVVGASENTVIQYAMSTALDLSTASFDGSTSVAAQDLFPVGLEFNSDGSKMFVSGNSNNRVYQYSLATPYDITSESYDNVFFQAAGPVVVAFFRFTHGGIRALVNFDGVVYELGMVEPFDIENMQPTGVTLNVSGSAGLDWDQVNRAMIVTDLGSATIHEYTA